MRLTTNFVNSANAAANAADAVYAWYRFQEPEGTVYNEADLSDAETLCDVFGYARLGLARITAQGWRFLWRHYGLDGLLDVHRRADWCYRCGPEAAAAELVRASLTAGYDPVSGLIGAYRKDAGRFELATAE